MLIKAFLGAPSILMISLLETWPHLRLGTKLDLPRLPDNQDHQVSETVGVQDVIDLWILYNKKVLR